MLQKLCSNPMNTVALISGVGKKVLESNFGHIKRLHLAAESGRVFTRRAMDFDAPDFDAPSSSEGSAKQQALAEQLRMSQKYQLNFLHKGVTSEFNISDKNFAPIEPEGAPKKSDPKRWVSLYSPSEEEIWEWEQVMVDVVWCDGRWGLFFDIFFQ